MREQCLYSGKVTDYAICSKKKDQQTNNNSQKLKTLQREPHQNWGHFRYSERVNRSTCGTRQTAHVGMIIFFPKICVLSKNA